jgi:hypothetical protein
VTVLVACGQGAPSAAPSAAPGPRGFLAVRGNSVFYVQWTENAGAIVGSLRTVALAPDMRTTSPSSENFTGLINGGAFTINFPSSAALGSWQGTLTSDGASIQITDATGKIESVPFQSAANAEYNADVGKLQGEAQKVDAAVANVETAIAVATASKTAYDSARTKLVSDSKWSSYEPTYTFFWEAIDSDNLSDALYWYKEAVKEWKDPVIGPPGTLSIAKLIQSDSLSKAQAACDNLKGQSDAIFAARDGLVSAMAGLGLTPSQSELSAANSTGDAVSEEAFACAGDLPAVTGGLDSGFATTKAAYNKVVQKAKSLGW